jgi:hypothetical protein
LVAIPNDIQRRIATMSVPIPALNSRADADIAKVLTMDEARRVASNIAKLPNYLAANPDSTSE